MHARAHGVSRISLSRLMRPERESNSEVFARFSLHLGGNRNERSFNFLACSVNLVDFARLETETDRDSDSDSDYDNDGDSSKDNDSD